MPKIADQHYLNPREAAKVLRVDVRTVYTYLRNGELPAVKIGGVWRIDRERLGEMARKETR